MNKPQTSFPKFQSFDLLATLVAVVNGNGVVGFANAALEDALGASRRTIEGSDFASNFTEPVALKNAIDGVGGANKAAVVKRLVEKARAADAAAAELAEVKRQLAAAKKAENVDADEVAQLRAQLKAAKEAAAARKGRSDFAPEGYAT